MLTHLLRRTITREILIHEQMKANFKQLPPSSAQKRELRSRARSDLEDECGRRQKPAARSPHKRATASPLSGPWSQIEIESTAKQTSERRKANRAFRR
jgi:hypothetical protein